MFDIKNRFSGLRVFASMPAMGYTCTFALSKIQEADLFGASLVTTDYANKAVRKKSNREWR
jgi:hypothetical protein